MTTTWIPAGVSYCLAHHGVANEDDTVCDFSRSHDDEDEPQPCDFRDLAYKAEP